MATAQPVTESATQGFFKTLRMDAWWTEAVFTVLALGFFTVYATWAAMQGAYYEWGPYISPFYSPNLKQMFPEAFSWVSFSPAFLVLWAPLGFRGTCYFYRRAYYRSIFLSPPSCAVTAGTPTPKQYSGETKFPFLLQNIHRYFFYVAAVLTVFHWVHAVHSLFFEDGLGVGVGTLLFWIDATFLTLYTFSCHSWRHILGGRLNRFSESLFSKLRHKGWMRQSIINEHHMAFAWISLFTVGLVDLYVRLLAMGIITDIRLL